MNITKILIEEPKNSFDPYYPLIIKIMGYFYVSFMLDIILLAFILKWNQYFELTSINGINTTNFLLILSIIIISIMQALIFEYLVCLDFKSNSNNSVIYLLTPPFHFLFIIIISMVLRSYTTIYTTLNNIPLWEFVVGTLYLYLRLRNYYLYLNGNPPSEKESKKKLEKQIENDKSLVYLRRFN